MDYNQDSAKNTLRLGERELEALINRIEQDSGPSSSPNREFVRWEFRMVSVRLSIENINGGVVTIPVATRNISRGGMSVLHCSYIHSGSKCSLELVMPNGRQLKVTGRIARCTHIGGKVHEAGIVFDEQVSTRDLLGLDPMEEAYSLEHVDPELLIGTVVIVTGSEMDRDILLNFLDLTQLIVRVASTIDEAIERTKKGCDLIFTDLHLGAESGVDLVARCRSEGIDVPILVMTAENGQEARDELRMAGASGYYSKPIEQHRLYQALAEFMLADGDGGPVHTTLTQSDPAYSLLPNFFANMPKIVVGLERALLDDDLEQCRELCRTLASSAAALGFAGVGELAIRADRGLHRGGAVSDAAADVRALIIACRRVRVKPAA